MNKYNIRGCIIPIDLGTLSILYNPIIQKY